MHVFVQYLDLRTKKIKKIKSQKGWGKKLKILF